jgi:hypothetical protein
MNNNLPARGRPGSLRGSGAALLLSVSVLGALLGASCSTTSGSSYSSSVSRDSSVAAAAKQAEDKKRASQPPSSGNPPPYYPPSDSSSHSYGNSPNAGSILFDIFVQAARVATSGTLVVEGLPPGVTLYVDGQANSAYSFLVPAGRHSLRAQGFGWEAWTGVVDISMGSTTSVSIAMIPSAFSLGAVRADPPVFDPEAPGSLRRVRIGFAATTPGTATIEVLDADSRTVHSVPTVTIDSQWTVATWDGRDRSGRALKPGTYRVHISAAGTSGSPSEAWGELTVAPNRAGTTFSSLAGGFSGAMYAPDARILPGSRLQSNIGAYAQFDPNDSSAARIPLFAGIRLGLPGGTSELSFSGIDVAYPGYDGSGDWASGSVSLKTSLASNDMTALSLLVGGTYGRYFIAEAFPSWDGPGRFPGVSAGLVFEFDSELARVFGSVQGEASTYYPNYSAQDITDGVVPGFFTWVYFRAGLELLLPDLLGGQGTAAFSVAGRTSPFNTGLSLTYPLSMGAELHWYLPHSNTVLSVYGSGEWAARHDWYLGGGMGLGFLL